MKFYDLGRVCQLFEECFISPFLNTQTRKKHHSYRFFTDGIGYIDQQIAADGLFEQGLIDHICDIAVAHGMTDLYVDMEQILVITSLEFLGSSTGLRLSSRIQFISSYKLTSSPTVLVVPTYIITDLD